MFGFPPDIVAWMTLAIFSGGLAKGISGVALPIVALSIALNFVEAQVGLALVALPIVLTNIWQAFGNGDVLQPLKRFWVMAVVFLIALYIGSQLVAVLPSWVLFAMIGTTAVIFVLTQVFKPRTEALSPGAERILGPLTGVVGGMMGGVTSVWGPPIIMFLFLLRLDKDTWVRSVTSLYLLGAIPLAFFYYQNGVLNGDRMWLSVAACVPAMAGILIGERLRRFINEELFRKLLLVAIFVAGLNMIRRGLVVF